MNYCCGNSSTQLGRSWPGKSGDSSCHDGGSVNLGHGDNSVSMVVTLCSDGLTSLHFVGGFQII